MSFSAAASGPLLISGFFCQNNGCVLFESLPLTTSYWINILLGKDEPLRGSSVLVKEPLCAQRHIPSAKSTFKSFVFQILFSSTPPYKETRGSFSFDDQNCLLVQSNCYLNSRDLSIFPWLHFQNFSSFCTSFNYVLYNEIPVNLSHAQSLDISMGHMMNQSFQITFVAQTLQWIMLWSTSSIWICIFETLVCFFKKKKCSFSGKWLQQAYELPGC